MIKYAGIELTDIVPVKIDDIVVSPIQLSPVARQRSITWGSDFVRMIGGTRTVTITFALLEISNDDRAQYLQDIRDWAKIGTNTESNLVLPEFSDKYLQCACTQLPEASYRKWWENKLKLVFTCFNNPFWTSSEQIDVQCGTVFSVGGSAPPLMTIERRGTVKLSNVSYATNTEVMTFSQIPAGQMVIDLNRQTAAIGNTSFMKYYVNSSDWITPRVGANQKINGIGTIRYRERWV